MHISGLKQSKFLTRADVGSGVLVTIREVFQDNVAKEGAPPEMRWCMAFDEAEKPMVLNSTNGQIIAQILKSEETDNWIGHQIVLFDDPSVSFGGKLVGGIRVRAPRGRAAAKTATAQTHAPAAKPALAKPAPEPPAASPELDPESDTPF